MSLTDVAVKNAKPSSKAFKLSDGNGLYLLVQPTGSKLWRYKYRLAGKEKVLALGIYGEISLRQARDKRDAARRLLSDGVDPAMERKAAKLRQAALWGGGRCGRSHREWHGPSVSSPQSVVAADVVPEHKRRNIDALIYQTRAIGNHGAETKRTMASAGVAS